MVVACAPLGGCVVYYVVKVPVDVAVTATEVAGTVAVGTVKVAGSVAGSTIRLAGRLATAGAVTVVDVATNEVTRVPYRQGLTLAGASDAAKVKLAQHAVDVVRDGKLIYSAAKGAEKNMSVAPGDVVQIGK